MNRGEKLLVTGGVKSGKSDFALRVADGQAGEKIFVATAQALDDEMKQRIEQHKKERPAEWHTVEEQKNLAAVFEGYDSPDCVMIVDCLTLWTANLMESASDAEFEARTDELASAVTAFGGTAILVTNETGLGIIPENKVARAFGRRLGTLNRKMAQACDKVVLLVAGLPMDIKGGNG